MFLGSRYRETGSQNNIWVEIIALATVNMDCYHHVYADLIKSWVEIMVYITQFAMKVEITFMLLNQQNS